jgi:hypothetical protein
LIQYVTVEGRRPLAEAFSQPQASYADLSAA